MAREIDPVMAFRVGQPVAAIRLALPPQKTPRRAGAFGL